MKFEYEKYICSIESTKETLEKFGVAIVEKILVDEECTDIIDKMWSHFEHITQKWKTPINRNNTATYREIFKLFPTHGMLFQHFNIGHTQISWNIRQHPKIIEIFCNIWDCTSDELLVSFDGISFGVKPEDTNRGYDQKTPGFHTDQSYTIPDFKCIQSWVTALDVEEGDATLSIYEGSHKYHQEFAKTFNILNKDNWFKLAPEHKQFYLNKGLEETRICCLKGSLVLWDSRTIHYGANPIRGRAHPKLRSIIYLCYMPREQISAKDLQKKRKAFNELRTTSHWTDRCTMFPKTPRTYGGVLPEITPIPSPILNSIGRRLAGF